MNAPLPTSPRALVDALAQEISGALGPRASNRLLVGLLAKIDATALSIAPPAAPPPDPKAKAGLSVEMGTYLDELEDLLDALALGAAPQGG